jgi:hypothetical protein
MKQGYFWICNSKDTGDSCFIDEDESRYPGEWIDGIRNGPKLLATKEADRQTLCLQGFETMLGKRNMQIVR